jgi:(2Fe-2S) ferredoxin
MGKSANAQISTFQLEGRFLKFVVEDGYKLKRMWVATADGECCIKLSKAARASVGRVLMPGDWIKITGYQKIDWKTGEVKLKAELILPAAPHAIEPTPIPAKPAKPKASILVCQKSDCMKRGGRGICKALEASLSERGLTDEVAIKGTGCMKHCKAGPNVVFMPDKTRYSRISPEEVPALIDKHFPTDNDSVETSATLDTTSTIEYVTTH